MNHSLLIGMELIESMAWVALGFAPTIAGLSIADKALKAKSRHGMRHFVLRKEVVA
jgi:hypothetical protein